MARCLTTGTSFAFTLKILSDEKEHIAPRLKRTLLCYVWIGNIALHNDLTVYELHFTVAGSMKCLYGARSTTGRCEIHHNTRAAACISTRILRSLHQQHRQPVKGRRYVHCLYCFNTSHQLSSSVTSKNSKHYMLCGAVVIVGRYHTVARDVQAQHTQLWSGNCDTGDA